MIVTSTRLALVFDKVIYGVWYIYLPAFFSFFFFLSATLGSRQEILHLIKFSKFIQQA